MIIPTIPEELSHLLRGWKYKMSGNTFITFGGIKLDKSSVANMRTQICTDYYGSNKTKVYIVEFKNGVKACYTETNISGAAINSSAKSWGDTTTNAYGVMGLELKGTKHQDTINVTGGTLRCVDVANNGGGDDVTVTNALVDHQNINTLDLVTDKLLTSGVILTDSHDNTYIKNPHESDYTREGTFYNLKTHEQGVRRLNL